MCFVLEVCLSLEATVATVPFQISKGFNCDISCYLLATWWLEATANWSWPVPHTWITSFVYRCHDEAWSVSTRGYRAFVGDCCGPAERDSWIWWVHPSFFLLTQKRYVFIYSLPTRCRCMPCRCKAPRPCSNRIAPLSPTTPPSLLSTAASAPRMQCDQQRRAEQPSSEPPYAHQHSNN